ncbi:hypothetical protein Q3P76_003125 [Salmonella enterica]|nr:hypothetical protein [Salmonella enterica]EHF6043433.1 hypothetical protein [Salmonella enterica]ELE7184928.1 hypothetical protein [Salmonella enterica]ELH2969787.1 hypothetical protein [Salmonella enterica]ELM4634303.1 hypothetical protein [Salmonella enterica]
MAAKTQSSSPKYVMTQRDIERKIAHEREMMVVETVTRVMLQEGVEPQLTLKDFAKRFRNGDFKSVQTDADRHLLILARQDKNYQRRVDMVAYFSAGVMNFFNNQSQRIKA